MVWHRKLAYRGRTLLENAQDHDLAHKETASELQVMERSAGERRGMRPSGSSPIASLKEILNLDKVRVLGSGKIVTVAHFLSS